MKLNYVVFIFVLFFSSHISAQQQTVPWKANDKDVSILVFGDTNIQNRDNPVEAFKYLLPTFQAADVRIGNLEGPFAGTSDDPMRPDIPHKENWSHSEPEMVEGIVGAGIDAVSVANNVSWPWMALMRSIKVLEEHNIPYTGGGKNIDAAHEPVILEKNGTKIGFLAYACTVFPFQHAAKENRPGIATVRINTSYQPPPKYDKPGTPPVIVTIPVEEELQRMEKDIADLKEKVDIVISSYHWGRSHYPKLIDYQIKVAHAAIDAGADVIMGHGNHLLGPVEVYKNKPVFYGLANLVFDWFDMLDRKNGMLAKVDVKNGELDRVSFVPLYRNEDNLPEIKDPNSGIGAELYTTIKNRSEGYSTLEIDGKEVLVNLK